MARRSLVSIVVPALPGPPAGTATEGQLYYDTTRDALIVYSEGEWVVSDGPGHTYVGPTAPDATTAPSRYLWWDTSVAGAPTLWIEDGT